MGPGGFDMQQIFAAAQQALSAQQELANTEVTGTAGGGAVRAVVSGVGQLLDVTIDPSVIDPADPAETASTVADLVLAAVRDAWESAIDLQQRQVAGEVSVNIPPRQRRTESGQRTAHDLIQGVPFLAQTDARLLHAGDVQQVRDHAVQPLRLAADRGRQLAALAF